MDHALWHGVTLKLLEVHRLLPLDVHEYLTLEHKEKLVLVRVFVKGILAVENAEANNRFVHVRQRFIEPRFVSTHVGSHVDQLAMSILHASFVDEVDRVKQFRVFHRLVLPGGAGHATQRRLAITLINHTPRIAVKTGVREPIENSTENMQERRTP